MGDHVGIPGVVLLLVSFISFAYLISLVTMMMDLSNLQLQYLSILGYMPGLAVGEFSLTISRLVCLYTNNNLFIQFKY